MTTDPDVDRETRFAYDDRVDAHAGAAVDPVPRDATDPLFRTSTAGTTGEPERVTHATGGRLAQVAWSTRRVPDVTADTTV